MIRLALLVHHDHDNPRPYRAIINLELVEAVGQSPGGFWLKMGDTDYYVDKERQSSILAGPESLQILEQYWGKFD